MKLDEPGAQATEAQLRPVADAFVRSRAFPGAPSPRFESARPNILRSRTDWIFRYRVGSTLPIGNVVPYLQVYFTGNKISWILPPEVQSFLHGCDKHQFADAITKHHGGTCKCP